jgi:hypothetical protein
MFLLKIIYKPFVLLILLLFSFIVGLGNVLAKLGSIAYGLFILFILGILLYTGFTGQWFPFVLFFCVGFASYVVVAAIMALGLAAESINEKLVQILVS